MLENIKWLGHATIKFLGEKIIYIDPYKINENYNDADIIFVTHDHYDHYSEEDLKKCMKKDTKIVVTNDLNEKVLNIGFEEKNILLVDPNNRYEIDNIKFETVCSYNINKDFHPKENNWVGYILTINDIKYYIAGDTDLTEESKKVKCHVAFLPIGGTYTMNYKEAASLANVIKPKVVVPIHYATIVGSEEDAIKFKDMIDADIECSILY